ncbi:MAG: DNA-binding response regulator [Crocinitomicaceae bacterium]|nr:DNA-binding response regulator [Crocinitomicaceae bacterium]|tara:strand:+ start:5793 stop:6545 length:753 start_codon:yes stop_codon:yes gene_type:complete
MGSGIRVLVVEDEFMTIHNITVSLSEVGYRIAGMAKNANEALKILESKDVDIAILDINIQGEKDGIWLAGQITEKFNIPFIFLTAYNDEKTVKNAIETQPFGYLIKPFSTIDIYAAIELALKNFEQSNRSKRGLTPKPEVKSSPIQIDDHLFLKESHLYSRIKIKEILFVKADSRYVELGTATKKYHLRYTFLEFLEMLPQEYFIQTHRSYIVNINEVKHLGANFLRIGDAEIPISNKRKEEVLKVFKFL